MRKQCEAIMINREPIVGQWYRPQRKGRAFQVVAFEPDTGAIEIQKFDGRRPCDVATTP